MPDVNDGDDKPIIFEFADEPEITHSKTAEACEASK